MKSAPLTFGMILVVCSTMFTRAIQSQHLITCEPLERRQLLSSYFVDPTAGSDGNAGRSWRTPWQSLSAVNAHTFRRGDKVYLTGTFSGESLTFGAGAMGVSVNSYAVNAERTSAKLGVPNAVVLGNVPGIGIDISTSNISIQNLIITADPASLSNGAYNYGIYLENHGSVALSHETINNVAVSGFSYAGLCMQGWNTSTTDSAGFSNVLIENSSFHDNMVSGIFAGTGDTTGNEFAPDFPATFYAHSNLMIKNCQTWNNAGFNPALTASYDGTHINDGNFADGGIFISSVNNATVQNCTAFNNCFNANGGVGIWTFDSNRVNFQADESYDNKTAGNADGDGFDFDHGTTNSTMQRDYSHGNAGIGFFLTTFGGSSNNNNDTIKFCISDDDGQQAGAGVGVLTIANTPVLGASICNNTILTTGSTADISLSGDATSADTVNIFNNIFITDSTAMEVAQSAPAAGVVFGGNDYWNLNAPSTVNISWGDSTFTSLADWVAASHATAEQNVDPQLIGQAVSDLAKSSVSNLMLNPQSPVRKGAMNLASHHIAGIGKLNFFNRPTNRQGIGAG